MPLPRQVFADAAVRSVVVVGQKKTPPARGHCRVVTSTSFDHLDKSDCLKIKAVDRQKLNVTSWTSLFLTGSRTKVVRSTRRLEAISTIRSGLPGARLILLQDDIGHTNRECEEIFRRYTPFGYVPAILSRNVKHMSLQTITFFSRLRSREGAGGNAVTGSRCVAVRRLVADSGRLVSAPLLFRSLPVKGTIIIDRFQIDPHLLSAILGSETVTDWLRFNTGTLINPKFQTITIGDLGRIPIPIVATQFGSVLRRYHGSTSAGYALCRMIVQKGRALGRPGLKEARRESLQRDIDELVSQLYNLQE